MFTISERKETHERYVANQMQNFITETLFKESVRRFELGQRRYGCSHNAKKTEISIAHAYADVPYGTSTVFKGGHVICVLKQALEFRFPTEEKHDIKELAEYVAKMGYYEPNKGACHCLFDHLGCRRATDIQELIDTLMRGSIITCLVENKLYHNDLSRTGRTYVNVVGLRGQNFIIDDPFLGRREMFFTDFARSIQIAWIW